jgi:hypothetical protein
MQVVTQMMGVGFVKTCWEKMLPLGEYVAAIITVTELGSGGR